MRTMTKFLSQVCLIASLTLVGAFQAKAAAPDPSYFAGVWALQDKANCGNENGEFAELEADGTFHVHRFGRTEIVGFWSAHDEKLSLELLTSPNRVDPRLSGAQEAFAHLSLDLLTFDRTEDAFRMVTTDGEEVGILNLYRCD